MTGHLSWFFRVTISSARFLKSLALANPSPRNA